MKNPTWESLVLNQTMCFHGKPVINNEQQQDQCVTEKGMNS